MLIVIVISNLGHLGTIFAYGQTGTGKTFTASGILFHAFAHVFAFMSKSARDTQFLLRASYYEIYNEEIRDLLVSRIPMMIFAILRYNLNSNLSSQNKNSKSLELKESPQGGVYVKDLSCFVVNNLAELEKLKEIGMRTIKISPN